MNYIVFDLEASCGEGVVQSEIIEIGAVKLNEKLEVVDEFQAFIRPVIHPTLTYFCEELTSITQADVDNAKTFLEVLPEFINWCRQLVPFSQYTDDYVLCSWGYYDKKMLKQDCAHWSIGPSNEWFDGNHYSIKHMHGALIGNKKGVGMAKALDMLNLKLDGTHHRGIDDARNIAKIFVEIFPQLNFDKIKIGGF